VIAISLSILIVIDCLSLLLFYWNKKVRNTPFLLASRVKCIEKALVSSEKRCRFCRFLVYLLR